MPSEQEILDNMQTFFTSLKNRYQTEAYDYLYKAAGLKDFEVDIKARQIKAIQKGEGWRVNHSIHYLTDPDNKFRWHTNQVFAAPFNEGMRGDPAPKPKLFALAGPQHTQDYEEDLFNFFWDVLDLGEENESNIKHLVCCGSSGYPEDFADFINYFDLKAEPLMLSMFPDPDDLETLLTLIISTTARDREIPGINRYELNIERIWDRADVRNIKNYKLTVLNIPTPDCEPIELSDQALLLLGDLAGKLEEEGIAVHCRAGLGRTGQIVTYLALLHSHRWEAIFADADEDRVCQRLSEFMEALRARRPGLVIAHEQLWCAVRDVQRYRQLILAQQRKGIVETEEVREPPPSIMYFPTPTETAQPVKHLIAAEGGASHILDEIDDYARDHRDHYARFFLSTPPQSRHDDEGGVAEIDLSTPPQSRRADREIDSDVDSDPLHIEVDDDPTPDATPPIQRYCKR